MSKPIHSYTIKISEEQIAALENLLKTKGGFEFVDKPYAIFSAKKEKLSVTVYEKGPKVLVQGRKTENFVKSILEPDILGEARLGREEDLDPNMFEPHFGIDESGKGDYFGPLVISGAFTDRDSTKALMEAGVTDSKRISSDKRIRALADAIREIPGVTFKTIVVTPVQYNHLYLKYGNVNSLLAQGHAKVIELLFAAKPDCPRALSDQFTSPSVLLEALGEKRHLLKIEQRTKAESDVAVATASILAREAFISWIDNTSEDLGIALPKGASEKVKEIGRTIVKQRGAEGLKKIAKTHFQTHLDILNSIT